jgi:hypothetical protein
VTNCVTIGFSSGGASLPLRPSRGSRWWSSTGCGFEYRDQIDDRDVKLAALIDLTRSRNHQVKALNVKEGRCETVVLP